MGDQTYIVFLTVGTLWLSSLSLTLPKLHDHLLVTFLKLYLLENLSLLLFLTCFVDNLQSLLCVLKASAECSSNIQVIGVFQISDNSFNQQLTRVKEVSWSKGNFSIPNEVKHDPLCIAGDQVAVFPMTIEDSKDLQLVVSNTEEVVLVLLLRHVALCIQ